MQTIEHTCPCCRKNSFFSYPAFSMPFITKSVFNGVTKKTEMLFCTYCGFSFFKYRYKNTDIVNIYSGYRSESYQTLRESVEPSYTKLFNEMLGGTEYNLASRKDLIRTNLKKINFVPERILDYGGDRGQIIPDELINNSTTVFDVSNSVAVKNIRKINDEAQLSSNKWDLIFINHVLEHVTDVKLVMNKVDNYIERGGIVY